MRLLPADNAPSRAQSCQLAQLWRDWCEVNIASPSTPSPATSTTPSLRAATPSLRATAQDIRAIGQLEELVRLLREEPEDGIAFFKSRFGEDFHPDQRELWSQDTFAQLGLHPALASPAAYGHRTIKGIAFLDVDETQSNFKNWTPRSALDRALFVIEMAQQGLAVVPVTGSPFADGDPRFNISDRIERGELFMTPLLITDGGAEAHLLGERGYHLSEHYQREVGPIIQHHAGNWQTLHDDFTRIAETIIAKRLGTEWSKNLDAIDDFNQRSLTTERIYEAVTEVPPVMVQRFTPVHEADHHGRINFYVTLPAREREAREVIAEIDRTFASHLKDQGIDGLSCFPGFQHSFGVGNEVIQFSFDVGVISKSLAVHSLRLFETTYGLPIDARAPIWFGGDGANDIFFVKNFDQSVARSAPGLLSPRGPFLIQPGWEREEVKKGVIAHGWAEDQVIELPEGGLWCERLRAGFREAEALSVAKES